MDRILRCSDLSQHRSFGYVVVGPDGRNEPPGEMLAVVGEDVVDRVCTNNLFGCQRDSGRRIAKRGII